jgi:hypothetical protein
MTDKLTFTITGIRAMPVFPEMTETQTDFGPTVDALKQAAAVYSEPNHPLELHQILFSVVDDADGKPRVVRITGHQGKLCILVSDT